jgi:hypothetical protein
MMDSPPHLPQYSIGLAPTQQIYVNWPDGTAIPGNQVEFLNQEGSPSSDCQEPECPKCSEKPKAVRPQLTINVFNTGGSSAGGSGSGAGGSGSGAGGSGSGAGGSGSGAGGSGTGGAVTIGADETISHADPIARLHQQYSDLSQKMEQLSSSQPGAKLVIDSGSWNTMDIRPWNRPEKTTEARIEFSKKFSSVPTVTTSINWIDASRDSNMRTKVYATDISMLGFTIHADTWSDTQLYSCGVTWQAFGM